ncbi:hypothetical protein GIB67_039375 [Kingdonia uniflora]|uniref:Glucose-methanol-choline oxidoreductase N-terminal domain-containing protein n=1 Tax=Kingdonia uniflora TaxID=39325 RepID=A0A7J7LXB6_9MAGN|nr:hypothetical protein GIB67_039375 [Kingdonia uniflora]
MKIFCFFIYLSRTNEDSRNLAWDAIGYQLEMETLIKPKKERPLQKGAVETSYESDTTLLVGVVAAVLAKSGQKVVVVEKGHYFVAEDYSSLEGPSLSQLYESEEVLSTLDGKCMMLAGSTVGGSSAVNWSMSIETPTSLLKKWALDRQIPFFGSSNYVYAMDTVNNGTVILTGCKAERFILEKNHSGQIKKKKCVGLIASICSNKNIKKRVEIKAKVMISASESLLTPSLMLSSRLKNPNIEKNFHLHHVLMVWGYFSETLTDLPGKTFQGGIITSLHKILSLESESDVETVIEAPNLGPASFSVLLPWVSGRDVKK